MDSTLVKANVSGHGLAPSGMTVAEFKEYAIEENGLFMITETTVDEDGAQHETARYFQSPEGRMPLNPVDTDACWRTTRAGKASGQFPQTKQYAGRSLRSRVTQATGTAKATEPQGTLGNAISNSLIPPQYRLKHRRLTKSPGPEVWRSHCRRR